MIFFRADGNKTIGTGHIMRCLSIADAFKKNGEQAIFILADDSLKLLVEERGYETVILGTDYKIMSDELDNMRDLIAKHQPHCLFIDSYFVTKEYLISLKELVKTVYIDDLAAFAYPVDILINYNIYAEDIDYSALYKNENVKFPKMLLGLKYVPLREEFANVERKNISRKCENVLISTGGADPIHLSLRLAEYISRNCNDDLTYHFLIGAANTDRQIIEKIAENSKNIIIHSNVRNMKDLICSCDIAVSAAGSTLYEICACGLPIITYVLADNQAAGAEAFEKHGLAYSLADIRNKDNVEELIINSVKTVLKEHNVKRRGLCSMVDGEGQYRIIRFI